MKLRRIKHRYGGVPIFEMNGIMPVTDSSINSMMAEIDVCLLQGRPVILPFIQQESAGLLVKQCAGTTGSSIIEVQRNSIQTLKYIGPDIHKRKPKESPFIVLIVTLEKGIEQVPIEIMNLFIQITTSTGKMNGQFEVNLPETVKKATFANCISSGISVIIKPEGLNQQVKVVIYGPRKNEPQLEFGNRSGILGLDGKEIISNRGLIIDPRSD